MYLNCHTYYSFKYGAMSIEELLREAAAKGVRKLVLSDINNTSAILEAHRLTETYPEKFPVQVIAGIDFRNSSGQQFIGIAKNHHGFFALNSFLSKCLHEGDVGLTGREAVIPGRPPEFENAFVVYDFSSLRGAERRSNPQLNEESILLMRALQSPEGEKPVRTLKQSGSPFRESEGSAGIFSLRSKRIVASSPSRNGSRMLLAMTLKQNEFIGIRPSDLNRLKFSPLKNYPDKLVALAPVTFRNKTGFNAHRLLRAMDHNIVLSKLPVSEQASPDEIMIREEELCALYRDFPQIIHNTKRVLDECEPINFHFGENKNKKHFFGSSKEDYNKLIQLCEDGMAKRYPSAGEKIRARFHKEISVIIEKEFSSYFLINHDIIQFARRKNFFYVGRGSGANSMVAYLLYITDVDPIDLDLYFERFINPSRKNPPDFDLDFSSDERDEVIEHIFKTHSNAHTSLLATYSEMKDDSLIRELGKVFGLPKAEIDALQDYRNLPQTPDHITKLIYQYKEVLKTFPSHLSIHAGGVLISEKPIEYYSALSNPPKGFPLVQFSMVEAEDAGFAKFDILAQRGLGKVRDAVDLVSQNQNVQVDIHDVKKFFVDPEVRNNLKQAKLMGCFYVESPAMRMLLTKLRAETYLDLVAASSIIRPGVAQSGMMQEYIRRFHDKDHGRSKAIPQLWDIMPDTFGVMVYQEDVIKVAHFFAGLTLEESDMLRRGMSGKYRARSEFQKVEQKFFSNCKAKEYPDALTKEVWRQIESFAGYAFSKGHSASYAVESYQCMYLKTHFPLEYMVAVINNGGGFFGVQFYIHEARMCGGTIHAPDINHSDVHTSISGKEIYLGFNLLNDLERKVQLDVVAERNRNGRYSSLENFMKRVSISVDQLRILIRIGAFRFTGKTKQELLWDIHKILGHEKKSVVRRELFENGYKNFRLPPLDEMKYRDAVDEMEILGFPLCSPFELIALETDVIASEAKQSPTRPSDSLKGEPLSHLKRAAVPPSGTKEVSAGKEIFSLPSKRIVVSSPSHTMPAHAPSRENRGRRNDDALLLASDLKKLACKNISIIGYYVTRKPTMTKNGEPMMFGCFLDRNGYFFDTNHFPEATKKFPFRGAGCYLVKGKVAEEFGFYSINVEEMHKIDYLMYEEDAETKARSKPDPVIVPPVVPASKHFEYKLTIIPPPHVQREVMLLKKKFHRQFDHYQSVISKPEIVLGKFQESDAKETEIIRKIVEAVSKISPVKISLEDFDARSSSVFIKILNPEFINDVTTELSRQLKLTPKQSQFFFQPQLFIARGMEREKLSRASAEFCEQKYAASFVAAEMVLLKREANVKFAKYEVVRGFKLTGKPTAAGQRDFRQ